MMHAKTAVVDGCWSRVGSTNLNIASWIGNWELDVVIEDETFAREMQTMYVNDLARSTEIVLETGWRHPITARNARPRGFMRHVRGFEFGLTLILTATIVPLRFGVLRRARP